MDGPNIKTAVLDEGSNVQYEIYAYRTLTQAEAIISIRYYLANTKKSKRPKSGDLVQIITVFGARD